MTFSNVRKLAIGHGGPATPGLLSHIPLCFQAFPNITELELVPTNYSLRRENSALLRLRTENQEQQVRHGTWQDLTRLSGDVLGLFALGLLRTVSHLECVPRRSVPLKFMSTLRQVLSDARPTSLSISLHGRKALDEEEGLVSVLRDPAIATLRDLVVEIRLIAIEAIDPFPTVMEDVIRSLRSLPPHLQRLDLALDYHVISRLDSADTFSRMQKYAPRDGWHARVEAYERADLLAFASRIHAAVPPLTEVTVRLSDRCDEEAARRRLRSRATGRLRFHNEVSFD
ncbi:hypothetical protein OH77DRAFT_1517817 [Trametes cingulata]|nr:hypothetical protein OH77DRAFT_1517817 [Trametes cingulata]